MYVKIIDTYRYVVAICDKELIGKKFEEKESKLEIKEKFYKGQVKNAQETKEIIRNMKAEDATFNIVGEKAVQVALEEEIIRPEGIKTISGVPYALVLL